jgi:hypothetical protein
VAARGAAAGAPRRHRYHACVERRNFNTQWNRPAKSARLFGKQLRDITFLRSDVPRLSPRAQNMTSECEMPIVRFGSIALFAMLLGACTVEPVVVDKPPAGPVTDVTLTPPSTPEKGWQLSIAPFSLERGQELQQCYFFEVPYDEPVYVHQVAIAQTTGTHHMNIFRVRSIGGLDGVHGDHIVDGECWKAPNWSDWPLVVNSQNQGNVELTLPEGVAHRFEPREKIMLQTHYVNATTQKTYGVGKVLVNFHRIAKNDVAAELGTAFATNQDLRVCPGQTGVTFETTCRFASQDPVTIFGVNGHFHSRGKRFTMAVFDPVHGSGTPFYENTSWDEPLFARNLALTIPPRGGISYACEFAAQPNDCGDPADSCCFTFGGKVEQQEHCNAFIYYYPRRSDTDVICF